MSRILFTGGVLPPGGCLLPGGGCFLPGGMLPPGGVPGGDPPGRLLLRAVRILLECNLVKSCVNSTNSFNPYLNGERNGVKNVTCKSGLKVNFH